MPTNLESATLLASYYGPNAQTKNKDGAIVHSTRDTYGGNRSAFCGKCSNYTAELQTLKLQYIAIVSECSRAQLSFDI